MTKPLTHRKAICPDCKIRESLPYMCYCKPCRNKRARASQKIHRKPRPEYWKKKRELKDKNLLARDRRNAKAMRVRYPEKHKARHILNGAIRSGKIVKPERCQRCFLLFDRIEGHHHVGYENPLFVMWLCVECHRKVHRAMQPDREEGA